MRPFSFTGGLRSAVSLTSREYHGFLIAYFHNNSAMPQPVRFGGHEIIDERAGIVRAVCATIVTANPPELFIRGKADA